MESSESFVANGKLSGEKFLIDLLITLFVPTCLANVWLCVGVGQMWVWIGKVLLLIQFRVKINMRIKNCGFMILVIN